MKLGLWEQQKPLIEKHNDTISSLSFSLAKLIESDKQPKSALGPYPRSDDTEPNVSPTSQPISTRALRQTITVTTPNQPPSDVRNPFIEFRIFTLQYDYVLDRIITAHAVLSSLQTPSCCPLYISNSNICCAKCSSYQLPRDSSLPRQS
jgi:hypothetical protein